MFLNFVEAVKEYFTPEFKQQLSEETKESISQISTALDILIPLSLAGMLRLSTSDEKDTEKFYELCKSQISFINSTPPITKASTNTEINQLVQSIFGKKHDETLEAISQFSSVKTSTIITCMYSIFPPLLGLLGKHAEKNKLSENGLMGFLSSQRKYILKAIPKSLANLEILMEVSKPKNKIDSTNPKNSQSNYLLKWIVFLLVIGIALVVWLLLR